MILSDRHSTQTANWIQTRVGSRIPLPSLICKRHIHNIVRGDGDKTQHATTIHTDAPSESLRL